MPKDNTSSHQMFLGNGKSTYLTASQTISLASMIDKDVLNRSAIIYHRFIVNHTFYTSETENRSHRHCDFFARFSHPTIKFGIVVGLFSVKPECVCGYVDFQECQCQVAHIVILQRLHCETGFVFSDRECNVSSHFLKEYHEAQNMEVIKPEQLKAKCIPLKLGNRYFLCEMPCRFMEIDLYITNYFTVLS